MIATANFPEVEKAVQYFNEHRIEIVRSYPGQYVVIADDQVVGAFPNYFSAYNEITKTKPLGTFGIMKALPEDESISTRICNRYLI